MKKILKSILIVSIVIFNTSCDATDGDVYLGVYSVGVEDLTVDGVNIDCLFTVCSNASGEFDKVDPGVINYSYTSFAYDDSGYMIEDDPDTSEDESQTEYTGSFTLVANEGSFAEKGEDLNCLFQLSYPYTPILGEVTSLVCE